MSSKHGVDDLAADLAADLLADMVREEVVPIPVATRRRFTVARTPSVFTMSSKLQVSPSHWSRPSFGIAPDGFQTDIGPLHFELFLH